MCGILCVIRPNNNLTTFLSLLNKLQHRGQDSFGFAYLNKDNEIISFTKKGLIKDFYNYKNIESSLFLGHTRYITSGNKNNSISQPIIGTCRFGEFVFVLMVIFLFL